MAKARTRPTPDAPASAPEAVSADGKVFFKLNHMSHRPGCEGVQGEVIRLGAEDVAYFLARNGGDVCDANGVPLKRSKPVAAVQPDADDDSDSDDDDNEDGDK
jgi:hypothetical protein